MRPPRRPPPSPPIAVLLLVACAHAPLTSPPASLEVPTVPEAQRRALAGTWVYSGGDVGLADVDRAVEQATAEMGFARGIAAAALQARARPRDSYTLRFDGSTVSIVTPDYPTEQGIVGGPPVEVTDRFGDTNQTTFQLKDGALVESGKSTDGSGETIFTPGGDGRTLTVRQVMRSDRLSAPVDVTLSYSRQH